METNDPEPQVLTSGVLEPVPSDNREPIFSISLNSWHSVGSLKLAMMGVFTPQKSEKTYRSHFSSEQVVNTSTPLAIAYEHNLVKVCFSHVAQHVCFSPGTDPSYSDGGNQASPL